MPAPAEGFAPTAKDVYPGISPDKYVPREHKLFKHARLLARFARRYKGIHDGKVVFSTL